MVIKTALYATQAQYNIIDRWTEIRKVMKQFKDKFTIATVLHKMNFA